MTDGLNITYTDGSTATLTTRERPKLVLDQHLHPIGLFNGVHDAHSGAGGKGRCGTDWTYTLFQPIGGGK